MKKKALFVFLLLFITLLLSACEPESCGGETHEGVVTFVTFGQRVLGDNYTIVYFENGDQVQFWTRGDFVIGERYRIIISSDWSQRLLSVEKVK